MINEPTQVDIELKKAQAQYETANALRIQYDSSVTALNSLRWLLESHCIDTEKTILGSEPHLKRVFSATERKQIKNKMFEIIKKL